MLRHDIGCRLHAQSRHRTWVSYVHPHVRHLDRVPSDIGPYNIVMDPTDVCPSGYHFASRRASDGISALQHRPRCEVSPVTYYLIDLEGSRWFPEGREAAVVSANIKSQIKTAPEFNQPQHAQAMLNPFALDIYNLGKTFLEILPVILSSCLIFVSDNVLEIQCGRGFRAYP